MVMTVGLVVLLRDQAMVSSAPAAMTVKKPEVTLETIDARLKKTEKQLGTLEKVAYGPALEETQELVAGVEADVDGIDNRVTALESVVSENKEKVDEQNAVFLGRLGKLETDMQGTKGEVSGLKSMQTKMRALDEEQDNLAAQIAAFDEKMELLDEVDTIAGRVESLENKVVSGAQLHEDPKSVGQTSASNFDLDDQLHEDPMNVDKAPASTSGFDMNAFMAQFLEALDIQNIVDNAVEEAVEGLEGQSDEPGELEGECIVREGSAYRGNTSKTSTGRTCQSWDSQTPHQHDRTPENVPWAGLEGNYCRNPDQAITLWCYTTDPGWRWDWCVIESCAPCPEDQTQCGSGKCIDNSLVCDGIVDCPDEFDENYCEATDNVEATAESVVDVTKEEEEEDQGCKYLCDGDKCLIASQWCNGKEECDDGADESDCKDSEGCTLEQFTCEGGDCILAEWYCDGFSDCADASDELDCDDEIETDEDNVELLEIPGDETPEGNSEDAAACKSDQFSCDETRCIHPSWVCDGYDDCEDETDELGCICTSNEFTCANGVDCIPLTWQCDVGEDCDDGSDEVDCPEVESIRFTCDNGENIPLGFRCDNQNDCGDGSDEAGCNITMPCVDRFRCANGYCIPDSWRCDNKVDCADGTDEEDCGAGEFSPYAMPYCFSFEFRCVSSGLCIFGHERCDDRQDCDDGSDEEGCEICNAEDSFSCGNGQCVYESQRCDDTEDCSNGMDEIGCGSDPASYARRPSCESPDFQCTSSDKCIPASFVCDGWDDCGGDIEDEANCHHIGQCGRYRFKCESTGGCPLDSKRCNQQKDCPNGEDEKDCP
ncbi:sortilin-related receptor-like [Branchiostoma lanceolatum]|uniref:sortilin-related receptor-like n=1 Tax=Branchiostoma lanceolatum TaxID=7740 RepID=UPI003456AC9F